MIFHSQRLKNAFSTKRKISRKRVLRRSFLSTSTRSYAIGIEQAAYARFQPEYWVSFGTDDFLDSWKSNSTNILSATMAPFYTGPSINRNLLFTKRVFAVPKSLSYIFPILNLSKPESLNSGSRTLFSDRNHLLTMKLTSLNRIWKV